MTQIEFQKKCGGVIKNGWLIFDNEDSVDLSNNQLTSLPENIKFENEGSVYLANNQLTSLPENIKFENEDSVYLFNNQLTSLPENIKFENKGYVDLSNNQLTSLPENIKFENTGSVYLFNNKFKKLPLYLSKIQNLYIFQNTNWNDIKWINKILSDELTAEEVFSIDNVEHRRIAFEYIDKIKMKQLKNFKILDEVKDDGYSKTMKIWEFQLSNMNEPIKFLNCFCPSTNREYFLGTSKDKCWEAKAELAGFEAKEIEWEKEC